MRQKINYTIVSKYASPPELTYVMGNGQPLWQINLCALPHPLCFCAHEILSKDIRVEDTLQPMMSAVR